MCTAKRPFTTALLVLALSTLAGVVLAEEAEKHFHPKGKLPSKHTTEILEQARAVLPFDDTRDLEDNSKGFIAAPESMQIKAKKGHDAWDMERYQFLASGKQFPSIHPSLQRQSTLNLAFGLYEVIPGIYQVRGFDLSNVTFVRGKTGWIVIKIIPA